MAALHLALLSCQKEVGFGSPVTGNTGGNGTNTGNATGSYHPLTAGSYWKYKDTASGAEAMQKATATLRSINGRNYTAVVAVPGGTANDTTWMASTTPDYYMYLDAVNPTSGSAAQILFHYLNDSLPVGANWTYVAGQGNGYTANIKTSIVARGLTMTIQGKTYNNVIHTTQAISYLMFGQNMDMGTYDYYISKGVGIIKVRATISQMGQVLMVQTKELVEHVVM